MEETKQDSGAKRKWREAFRKWCNHKGLPKLADQTPEQLVDNLDLFMAAKKPENVAEVAIMVKEIYTAFRAELGEEIYCQQTGAVPSMDSIAQRVEAVTTLDEYKAIEAELDAQGVSIIHVNTGKPVEVQALHPFPEADTCLLQYMIDGKPGGVRLTWWKLKFKLVPKN